MSWTELNQIGPLKVNGYFVFQFKFIFCVCMLTYHTTIEFKINLIHTVIRSFKSNHRKAISFLLGCLILAFSAYSQTYKHQAVELRGNAKGYQLTNSFITLNDALYVLAYKKGNEKVKLEKSNSRRGVRHYYLFKYASTDAGDYEIISLKEIGVAVPGHIEISLSHYKGDTILAHKVTVRKYWSKGARKRSYSHEFMYVSLDGNLISKSEKKITTQEPGLSIKFSNNKEVMLAVETRTKRERREATGAFTINFNVFNMELKKINSGKFKVKDTGRYQFHSILPDDSGNLYINYHYSLRRKEAVKELKKNKKAQKEEEDRVPGYLMNKHFIWRIHKSQMEEIHLQDTLRNRKILLFANPISYKGKRAMIGLYSNHVQGEQVVGGIYLAYLDSTYTQVDSFSFEPHQNLAKEAKGVNSALNIYGVYADNSMSYSFNNYEEQCSYFVFEPLAIKIHCETRTITSTSGGRTTTETKTVCNYDHLALELIVIRYDWVKQKSESYVLPLATLWTAPIVLRRENLAPSHKMLLSKDGKPQIIYVKPKSGGRFNRKPSELHIVSRGRNGKFKDNNVLVCNEVTKNFTPLFMSSFMTSDNEIAMIGAKPRLFKKAKGYMLVITQKGKKKDDDDDE